MTQRATVLLILAIVLAQTVLAARPLAQRGPDERTAWNRPFAPFHVVGNIHYVGAAGVSAFLIVTPDGSILLDGGLPETAKPIADNITKLGSRLRDVKYLLNSHAHFDHAGGLAELKRMTGASLIASTGDAPALKAGAPDMPAVVVDRIVGDGEAVRLGDATLTAHETPGHTKGCTTWTMTTTEGGRVYRVVFYCSTSVVDRLVDNAGYPQIVGDYERTFAALRTLTADVFLANHPDFFEMEAKRKRINAEGPNPFIDPAEMGRFVAGSERQFRATLAKEQAVR
jgi:metallo-beta-lactamase class B